MTVRCVADDVFHVCVDDMELISLSLYGRYLMESPTTATWS